MPGLRLEVPASCAQKNAGTTQKGIPAQSKPARSESRALPRGVHTAGTTPAEIRSRK